MEKTFRRIIGPAGQQQVYDVSPQYAHDYNLILQHGELVAQQCDGSRWHIRAGGRADNITERLLDGVTLIERPRFEVGYDKLNEEHASNVGQ